MKINSKQALIAALATATASTQLDLLLAESDRRYGPIDDNNFYLVRDFLRLNWADAPGVLVDVGNVWTPVDGGEAGHFLHVSIDDSDKVSYTKDEDRGRDDVQTRTTQSAYYDKYGRQARNEDVVHLDAAPAPAADKGTPEKTDTDHQARMADNGGLSAVLGALIKDASDKGATSKDIVSAVNKALDILHAIVCK